MAECVLTCMGGASYLVFNGTTLLLFVSICLHHRAFRRLFQSLLNRLDEPEKSRSDQEILRNLIEFQITAKE